MSQIRLSNFSGYPFKGWLRTNTDAVLQIPFGRIGNAQFASGRATGLDTRILDVYADLAVGEQQELHFADAVSDAPPPIGVDMNWFGGPLTLNGIPMEVVSFGLSGAAFDGHLRLERVGTMLNVDVMLHWFPEQPWAVGECIVTASNPASMDMNVTVPAEGIKLKFGSAITVAIGRQGGANIVDVGTIFADGQARIVPLTFIWMEHITDPWQAQAAFAMASRGIGAVAIDKLLADGNPSYPPSFDARAWGNANFDAAVARLHTWEPSPIGPAQRSSDTGSQEDQVFVRGEALLPGGVGCEIVTYLAAIKMANRPCHHLEVDGSPVDPLLHPNLLMWDGRPRFQISPDHLGKPRELTEPETLGWWGPDVEHWLINTLAAAARYTGSPACQWLLGHHARIYLAQRTAVPSWSTSGIFSSRELGWEGILVTHLWRELADRSLAERVAERWRQRMTGIVLPKLSAFQSDIWDVRTEVSASLPVVPGWMPWQQAIATYGIDLASRILGLPQGSMLALRGAKRVLADAWVAENGRWVEYERLSLAGDKSRSGMFTAAWLPTAVAVVLRYEPDNAKAIAIRDQIKADTAQGSRSWLPPGF